MRTERATVYVKRSQVKKIVHRRGATKLSCRLGNLMTSPVLGPRRRKHVEILNGSVGFCLYRRHASVKLGASREGSVPGLARRDTRACEAQVGSLDLLFLEPQARLQLDAAIPTVGAAAEAEASDRGYGPAEERGAEVADGWARVHVIQQVLCADGKRQRDAVP